MQQAKLLTRSRYLFVATVKLFIIPVNGKIPINSEAMDKSKLM
ncbi:hypothetical protein PUND_b0371 [Pseudoalteromonas undina]|nr:hypothetical protein PUND_b0371 [Pseudoalteromonas undina]